MRNADLYKGISPDKQAEYEAWLVEQYGGDMPERIALSERQFESLSADEKQQLNQQLHDMEQGLAEGLRRGVPMGSPSLDPLLKRHRTWVAQMWTSHARRRPMPGSRTCTCRTRTSLRATRRSSRASPSTCRAR